MESQKLNFTRHITQVEEGTYFPFSFTVPENVYKLTVSYSYTRHKTWQDAAGNTFRQEINIIDLALHDNENNFRGWSGSQRSQVYICENHATPGYIPGNIEKGTWQIIFGAYHVDMGGCNVEIEIEFTYKARVLLKGDLHIHSHHSDGRYSVADVIRNAKLLSLDYIFLTDHNTYSGLDYITPDDSLALLPGMEMTNYNGHCNFLGVKQPVKSFFGNSKEEIIGIMQTAKDNGALICINHPFDSFCPWNFGFDLPFDAIEIQNAFFDNQDDIVTINWWQEQLESGKKIPIVGGSDNHAIRFMESIASPTTFLYSDSPGKTDILKAIKEGHAFISLFTDGPIVDMNLNGYIMGDTIPCANDNLLNICIKNLKPYDEIKIITNTGLIKTIINQTNIEKRIEQELADYSFIRLEIWRYIRKDVKSLACITNPIYMN